ncbi:MAG: SpoIID/LytB domain-containing protein [Mediterraneibacter sp.]
MRRYYIRQKMKSFGAFLIILILFPYIVSVFVNGADIRAGSGDGSPYVKVKVKDTSGNAAVTEVNWNEYLAGILAKEMPEEYELEAMKAQAVLIRTSLYQDLEESEDKVLSEAYLPRNEMEKKWSISEYKEYYQKYLRAAEETDDMVLFYNDTYAWAPFHQSSSGMTRSAEEVTGSSDYPYLAVRECLLDKEAENEIQVYEFEYKEIQKLCRDFLVAEEVQEEAENGYTFDDFEIQSNDSAGYVKNLRIGGTVCTGDQFRDALSLPSSCFSFSDGGEGLVITVTGNGHGLGMSQWTANEMAKAGNTYDQILQFFFEGTVINKDIQETELI